MKKPVLFLACILSLFLISCGGGGGGGSSSGGGSSVNSNPTISNLSFSPSSATLNQGGGSITMGISFNFIDNGGDVSTWTLFSYNSIGNLVSFTNQVNGVNGRISGTITGPAIYYTSTRGTFTVGVYITDAGGRQSNRLTGTFTVS